MERLGVPLPLGELFFGVRLRFVLQYLFLSGFSRRCCGFACFVLTSCWFCLLCWGSAPHRGPPSTRALGLTRVGLREKRPRPLTGDVAGRRSWSGVEWRCIYLEAGFDLT